MPWVKITAITMRKDPIFQTVFSGHIEHTCLGALPKMGGLSRRVRAAVPSVTMVNLPVSGMGRSLKVPSANVMLLVGQDTRMSRSAKATAKQVTEWPVRPPSSDERLISCRERISGDARSAELRTAYK